MFARSWQAVNCGDVVFRRHLPCSKGEKAVRSLLSGQCYHRLRMAEPGFIELIVDALGEQECQV